MNVELFLHKFFIILINTTGKCLLKKQEFLKLIKKIQGNFLLVFVFFGRFNFYSDL